MNRLPEFPFESPVGIPYHVDLSHLHENSKGVFYDDPYFCVAYPPWNPVNSVALIHTNSQKPDDSDTAHTEIFRQDNRVLSSLLDEFVNQMNTLMMAESGHADIGLIDHEPLNKKGVDNGLENSVISFIRTEYELETLLFIRLEIIECIKGERDCVTRAELQGKLQVVDRHVNRLWWINMRPYPVEFVIRLCAFLSGRDPKLAVYTPISLAKQEILREFADFDTRVKWIEHMLSHPAPPEILPYLVPTTEAEHMLFNQHISSVAKDDHPTEDAYDKSDSIDNEQKSSSNDKKKKKKSDREYKTSREHRPRRRRESPAPLSQLEGELGRRSMERLIIEDDPRHEKRNRRTSSISRNSASEDGATSPALITSGLSKVDRMEYTDIDTDRNVEEVNGGTDVAHREHRHRRHRRTDGSSRSGGRRLDSNESCENEPSKTHKSGTRVKIESDPLFSYPVKRLPAHSRSRTRSDIDLSLETVTDVDVIDSVNDDAGGENREVGIVTGNPTSETYIESRDDDDASSDALAVDNTEINAVIDRLVLTRFVQNECY